MNTSEPITSNHFRSLYILVPCLAAARMTSPLVLRKVSSCKLSAKHQYMWPMHHHVQYNIALWHGSRREERSFLFSAMRSSTCCTSAAILEGRALARIIQQIANNTKPNPKRSAEWHVAMFCASSSRPPRACKMSTVFTVRPTGLLSLSALFGVRATRQRKMKRAA